MVYSLTVLFEGFSLHMVGQHLMNYKDIWKMSCLFYVSQALQVKQWCKHSSNVQCVLEARKALIASV